MTPNPIEEEILQPPQVNPPLPSPAPSGAPAAWNQQPDSVAGNLQGLLTGNSTYIQRARQSGLETANRRGLLNSSMAVGAAEGAAYDAALPIAAADAQIGAQKNLARQGFEQQFTLNQFSDANNMARLERELGSRTALQDAQLAAEKERLGMQLTAAEASQIRELNSAMERLGMQLGSQQSLQEADIAARERMLEAELGSRESLQAAQLAVQKEMQGIALTAEEQRLIMQLNAASANLDKELAVRQSMQGLDIESRYGLLARELGSRASLQEAQLAVQKQMQGVELTSREKLALADLAAAEERLGMQLSLQERLSMAEIASRETMQGSEIAARYGLQAADAQSVMERLQAEIASREGLQATDIQARRDMLTEEISARYGLQEAEAADMLDRLEMELGSRENLQATEIAARYGLQEADATSVMQRLQMELGSRENLQATDIQARRDMLAEEIGARYGLQAVEAANMLDRLELELVSRERLQASEIAARYGLQEADIEVRQAMLETEIAARYGLRDADAASLMDRLEREIESREGLAADDIAARKTMLADEIAARYGLQKADATALMTRLDKEIASREDLAEMATDTQRTLATLDRDVQMQIAGMNVASHDQQQAISAATSIAAHYQSAFIALANNPDIPAATRESYLENILAQRDSSLRIVESMYNIDLSWAAGSGTAVSGNGSAGGNSTPPPRDLIARFDPEWYLAENPDVAASGYDPLEHYVLFGYGEGRHGYAGQPAFTDGDGGAPGDFWRIIGARNGDTPPNPNQPSASAAGGDVQNSAPDAPTNTNVAPSGQTWGAALDPANNPVAATTTVPDPQQPAAGMQGGEYDYNAGLAAVLSYIGQTGNGQDVAAQLIQTGFSAAGQLLGELSLTAAAADAGIAAASAEAIGATAADATGIVSTGWMTFSPAILVALPRIFQMLGIGEDEPGIEFNTFIGAGDPYGAGDDQVIARPVNMGDDFGWWVGTNNAGDESGTPVHGFAQAVGADFNAMVQSLGYVQNPDKPMKLSINFTVSGDNEGDHRDGWQIYMHDGPADFPGLELPGADVSEKEALQATIEALVSAGYLVPAS